MMAGSKNMISAKRRKSLMADEKGGTFVAVAFGIFLLVVILVGGVSAGMQAFNHTATHNKMLSAQTILADMKLDEYERPSEIPSHLLQEAGAALSQLDFYQLPANSDEAIYAIAYVRRDGVYEPIWQQKIYGGLPGSFYELGEFVGLNEWEAYIIGVGMRYKPPSYVYNVCDTCKHEYKTQLR